MILLVKTCEKVGKIMLVLQRARQCDGLRKETEGPKSRHLTQETKLMCNRGERGYCVIPNRDSKFGDWGWNHNLDGKWNTHETWRRLSIVVLYFCNLPKKKVILCVKHATCCAEAVYAMCGTL